MINAVLSAIGGILYPIFSVIFVCIDLLEDVFKAFAGTGVITINGVTVNGMGNTGSAMDTGIIYYLFQSNIVRNMLLSILLLAVILLVVFTFIAVFKNMYAPQPKKWQEIIGLSIKGLGLFIIVPVCALLGVWVGNILLIAIDNATSGSDYVSTLSGRLFVSSAYYANKIRTSADGVTKSEYDSIKSLCDSAGISIKSWSYGDAEGETDPDYEYYASLIDDCAAAGVINYKSGYYDGTFNTYYTTFSVNYLILIVGGIFILYVLGAISFGMVKRMFMLLILYVISPAVSAMYPIDEGSAFKSWTSEFKKNVLSAYGAVAGMNLFFALIPIIEKISISADWFGLVPLLLMIAGLYVVKDIISLISGFAGGGNAYTDGVGLMSSVKGRMKQVSGTVNKGAKSLVHGTATAFTAGFARREAGGSFFRGFVGSAGSSMLKTAKHAAGAAANMGGLGLDVLGIKKAGELSDKEKKKISGEQILAVAPKIQGKIDDKLLEVDRDGNVFGHRSRKEAEDGEDFHLYGARRPIRGKGLDYDYIMDAAEDAGIDVDKYLKNHKLTKREDIKSNREHIKDIDKNRSAYEKALKEQTEFANRFNLDGLSETEQIERLVNEEIPIGFVGVGLSEISKMILNGAKFSDADLSVDSIKQNNPGMSQEGIEEMISARRRVNELSDEMNEKKGATQSITDEMIRGMQGMKGLGSEVTDESISKLAKEIKEAIGNNTSSATSIDAMITAIKESSQKNEQKIASALSNAAKQLLSELKKNTSATEEVAKTNKDKKK